MKRHAWHDLGCELVKINFLMVCIYVNMYEIMLSLKS